MFRSGEIRWFFPGSLPAGPVYDLVSGKQSEEQPERVDRYLVLPGCTTTGVKFREGRFEIKAQTSAPEPVDYGNKVGGRRGTWVKWSCACGDLFDHCAAPQDDDAWAFVRKRRTVRLVSLEGKSPVDTAVGGPSLRAGCLVERTAIEAVICDGTGGVPAGPDWERARTFHSVAFEAFGEEGQLLGNLDRAVRYVVDAQPGLRLSATDSKSYPEWLVSLRP